MHNSIDCDNNFIDIIKNIHKYMDDCDKFIFNTCYKNITKELLDEFIKSYFDVNLIEVSHKLLCDTKRKTTYTIQHIYLCSKKYNMDDNTLLLNKTINAFDIEYKEQHTLKMYEQLHFPELYNDINKCYPVECAEKCIEFVKNYNKTHLSALDLGGGIGRTAFELIKSDLFDKVVGSDYSDVFVNKSNEILLELKTNNFLSIPKEKLNNISFLKIDACNLPSDKKYDLIFGGNLIDRLPNPTKFLNSVSSILNDNGILILTSPYTWLKDYTPKNEWIGGVIKNGENLTTYNGLKNILNKYFEEINGDTNKIFFSIKESEMIFQSSCADITYWIKR